MGTGKRVVMLGAAMLGNYEELEKRLRKYAPGARSTLDRLHNIT
jgi:hypothetical protein